MLLDNWTVYYARKAASGESATEFEDDSYNEQASAIERLLDQASDDDWEDVP